MRYPVHTAALGVLCCSCFSCTGPPAAGKPAASREGIVTLAPHLTEAVFAMGQGERVVAVGSFCDYPPEIASLPKVGGYLDPDLEQITLLAPALLVVPGKHQQISEYARLRGMAVVHVHMDSLATIDAGVAKLGEVLGCPEAAAALQARIRQELAAVRETVEDRPRPKVLIITGRTGHTLSSLFTVNGASFVSEVVAAAGGDNIYHDEKETYFEASKETTVLAAPDVVLEFHAGESLSDADRAAYVADWEQLPSLPAVKNGRVYLILASHALRPGPRVAEIARLIAQMLHPELDISTP